jgi:signal transduction histidine kinase
MKERMKIWLDKSVHRLFRFDSILIVMLLGILLGFVIDLYLVVHFDHWERMLFALETLSFLIRLGVLAFGLYAMLRWRLVEYEIAERQRTEEALRSSEQRYRSLLQATERQSQELLLLNRIIAAAASTVDGTTMLQTVCDELGNAFMLPHVVATLIEPDQERFKVVAEFRCIGRRSLLGLSFSIPSSHIAHHVLEQRTSMLLSNLLLDEHSLAFAGIVDPQVEDSLLVVPLIVREQVCGVIALNTVPQDAFSYDELELTKTVALAVGRALENVYLYSEIQHELAERKQIERLKDEFITTVSHELRTPLTSIRGALGLISGGVTGALPAQTKTMIEIAQTNSDRLLRLINDFLDIEKIEANKMVFCIQELKVMPLLEQALAANQVYAEQFGVVFELERTTIPPTAISTDSDRLMQVLNNLLANAAKFSPPNATVRVIPSVHAGRLRIAVADSGPGIPEDFRDRIFQKFAQADSSDTRQKGGTGLGLSIAKSIVERLGGEISYETELNVGTTFYVDLPLEHPQANTV